LLGAPIQDCSRAAVLCFGQRAETRGVLGPQDVGNAGEIGRDRVHKAADALGTVRVVHALCRRVTLVSGIGETAREVAANSLPLRDAPQHVRLWEPAHPHRPLDGLPFAIEGEPAIALAGDRDAAEIDLRRPDAVDLDLALAHGT